MLPRKTKVSYVKAGRTPSKRTHKRKQTLEEFHESFIPPTKVPHGLSPLARYLSENEDSGLTVEELIEQFQEYDCEHREKTKIVTGHKEILTCSECGVIEVKLRAA